MSRFSGLGFRVYTVAECLGLGVEGFMNMSHGKLRHRMHYTEFSTPSSFEGFRKLGYLILGSL